MVAESLTFIIGEVVNKDLVSSLQVGDDAIPITHLQYADDTLILLPKDSITVLIYKRLLQCFSIMTGLDINFSKSSLVHWSTGSQWLNSMA